MPAPPLSFKRTPPPGRHREPPLPRSLQPKRIDQSSSAYKKAARKYVNFMVAVPILLVTSYVLFDRLVMGNPVKTLHPKPQVKMEEKEQG
ncbi:hypothetical protein DL770_009453 [Monosporascus sp. CRB-9-2]|nr:hypothetical protein DL770_009453 [Monosporascus sp. CRB-9-2]